MRTFSQHFSKAVTVYWWLVFVLAVLAAGAVFLPQGPVAADVELPASRPVVALANAAIMLIVYGGLGRIGIALSRRLAFPEVWGRDAPMHDTLVRPGLFGAGAGVLFIVIDMVFSRFHALGPLPHPPFPTSLAASLVAGIGEEIIFRLFFISFWMWIVTRAVSGQQWRHIVFWMVAVLSAAAFAAAHIPSIMLYYGFSSMRQVPPAMLIELVILNGVLSLLAAYWFRRAGLLAAVSIHFWADVIWHVIWGAF